MIVKPAAGLKVRDPDLKDLLPEEGRNVPDSTYWRRRLRDGDVLITRAPISAGTSARNKVQSKADAADAT